MANNNLAARVAVVESRLIDINLKIDDDRLTSHEYRTRMEKKLEELAEKTDKRYFALSRLVWMAFGALAAIQFILKYGPDLKRVL